MRILGVDPGTVRTGWGIVDCDGAKLAEVDSGVLAVGRGVLAVRLAAVYSGLATILERHRPDHVSLEKAFLARNVQSAFRLGEARGVVLAAAAAAAVEVSEYAPRTIKKAVVGYGGAEKEQVQAAVVRIVGLARKPAEDEADALAAAICHALRGSFDAKVARALDRETGDERRLAPGGDRDG